MEPISPCGGSSSSGLDRSTSGESEARDLLYFSSSSSAAEERAGVMIRRAA